MERTTIAAPPAPPPPPPRPRPGDRTSAIWVASADPAPEQHLTFRPVTGREFATGGLAHRRHAEAVRSEWSAYRQSPKFLAFAASERSRSMVTAAAADPTFRPY